MNTYMRTFVGRRIVAAVAALSLTLGCGSNPSNRVDGGPAAQRPAPFEPIDALVIAPDSGHFKVHWRTRGRMPYPERARTEGSQAAFGIAYAIDTAGRLDPRTLTFLPPAPGPLFERAMCDWAYTVRFSPPLVDGKVRPVLVIQPFAFNIGDDRFPLPDMKVHESRLRELPAVEAVAWLRELPHCPR
jgi:hypothetical protein